MNPVISLALLLGVASAQNIHITTGGIAIATQGANGELIALNVKTGAEVRRDLPTNILSFDDVSIDLDNESLVFALSVDYATVCSFMLLDASGIDIDLIGCAGSKLAVTPFTGLSARGGTLLISGGTGGFSLFQYETITGMIETDPLIVNSRDLNVIGFPDVVMVDSTLAAFSTDFRTPGDSRFGTMIASIDVEGPLVSNVREFRVVDTSGFSNTLAPANFPLVNAIYDAGDRGVFMYTANGAMTVQEPQKNGEPIPFGLNMSDAVTVSVDSSQRLAVFGTLSSASSTIVTFDIVNPLDPVLLSSVHVAGRITSIAAAGGSIVYVIQGGSNIEILEGKEDIAPIGQTTMAPGSVELSVAPTTTVPTSDDPKTPTVMPIESVAPTAKILSLAPTLPFAPTTAPVPTSDDKATLAPTQDKDASLGGKVVQTPSTKAATFILAFLLLMVL